MELTNGEKSSPNHFNAPRLSACKWNVKSNASLLLEYNHPIEHSLLDAVEEVAVLRVLFTIRLEHVESDAPMFLPRSPITGKENSTKQAENLLYRNWFLTIHPVLSVTLFMNITLYLKCGDFKKVIGEFRNKISDN